MDFFNKVYRINFMGQMKAASIFSIVLSLIAIGSLATRGLNLGLDFSGGTLVEVSYEQPVELDPLRAALDAGGMHEAIVTHYGASREVLIRLGVKEGQKEADISQNVLNALSQHQAAGAPTVRRVEFVGGQVGKELTEQGGLALLFALAGITIYVALRFEFRFALGSIIAVVHDVLITVGVYSVMQWDFDLTVLAAVLAVIGYSINDTIVIFDRIRENFRTMRKGTTHDVFNAAINQTLSRTFMTGITTLMVLLVLFFFGGEAVHEFARLLIIGIIFGTYSSVYVASASALALGVSRADLMPVPKEGVADNRP